MAFEAGVYRQSIAEAFVEDNDTLDEINIIAEEDSETRGQAFLNFANSL